MRLLSSSTTSHHADNHTKFLYSLFFRCHFTFFIFYCSSLLSNLPTRSSLHISFVICLYMKEIVPFFFPLTHILCYPHPTICTPPLCSVLSLHLEHACEGAVIRIFFEVKTTYPIGSSAASPALL